MLVRHERNSPVYDFFFVKTEKSVSVDFILWLAKKKNLCMNTIPHINSLEITLLIVTVHIAIYKVCYLIPGRPEYLALQRAERFSE
jgi:hypothetical protein